MTHEASCILATLKDLVATATWQPGRVHPCSRAADM